MLDNFFLLIQKNSWGLLPDKKSATKAVISLVVFVLSIWWIVHAIESGKPKELDMNKIRATIKKHKSEFPENNKYVSKNF